MNEGQKKHLPKDQYKSDNSNKLIARGVGATGEYARLWKNKGKPVNAGQYSSDDVVFISANGNRRNRVSPDFNEIQKAIDAGATFLTDSAARRPEGGNEYNIGEQEVADYLRSKGYEETTEFNGTVARWTKKLSDPSNTNTEGTINVYYGAPESESSTKYYLI